MHSLNSEILLSQVSPTTQIHNDSITGNNSHLLEGQNEQAKYAMWKQA